VLVALGAGAGVWLADELREDERQPAAAAPTSTATPTQTVTVQESFTLTLTQPADGALTASPEATTYKKDASVTATATSRAGYRLTAWGGDCASTPVSGATCALTVDGSKTVSATFGLDQTLPLKLTLVSDGATDALFLEWTGGGADKWQYRGRTWNHEAYAFRPWGQWTDIPGSTSQTRRHRLTRLTSNTGYNIEIRPVVNGVAGASSNVAEGITHIPNQAPIIDPDQVVEGDGRTEWRLHNLAFVFVIPDGMRLRAGKGGYGAGGASVSVFDVESGSSLSFSGFGKEQGRTVKAPTRGVAGGTTITRNIGKLFDQIVASARFSP
jgi:hypothetical protein